jgi:undecaprenyl-diphosphatase
LAIVAHFLNIKDAFSFDTMLNIGTLIAMVIFFRKKIIDIIKRLFSGKEWSFVLKVIIATIPALFLGVFFADQIALFNGFIWLVALMLLVFGILMVVFGNQKRHCDDDELEKSISYKRSIKIGLAQSMALVPGVSRSGITILTGINDGLSMAKAAEFSFIMAMPIIAGATFKMLFSHAGIEFIKTNTAAFVIGNITSFVFGMLAVKFFINLISKRGLKDFGWYRIVLGVVLLTLLFLKII